ncbi:hypothetical protein ABKV19_026925 [Rosa sericea]
MEQLIPIRLLLCRGMGFDPLSVGWVGGSSNVGTPLTYPFLFMRKRMVMSSVTLMLKGTSRSQINVNAWHFTPTNHGDWVDFRSDLLFHLGSESRKECSYSPQVCRRSMLGEVPTLCIQQARDA